MLNEKVETRRAKKLYPGDVVSFNGSEYNVQEHVALHGYVYKPKTKKAKPKPKVMDDGTLEFGGRYRSEEWRKERKQRKSKRKSQNKDTRDHDEKNN